jgi:hypothetical protein
MAIEIKFTDLNWGDKFFITTDPEQLEHSLVGLEINPGSTNKKGERGIAVKFKLSFQGEISTVHEFEVTEERDQLKIIENSKDDID